MGEAIGSAEAGSPEQLILGRSRVIRELRAEIRQLASSPLRSVLVLGETGVGKDLIAQALLAVSPHPTGPLEVFNCPAIPQDHLESELFGTAKGAYPGAIDRAGAAERAAGGLLLLDEIGAMPLAHQGKILRLLEGGEGRRLGGTRTYRTDAAFVAATNEDLQQAIAELRFREDLYYRLVQDAVLRVPPLRERLDDLPVLAKAFLAELRGGGEPFEAPILEDLALARLAAHPWPGNVRELRAIVRGAARIAAGGRIRAEHVESALGRLPSGVPRRQARAGLSGVAGHRASFLETGAAGFHGATDGIRRQLLIDALSAARGNQTLAGVLLGLHVKRGEFTPHSGSEEAELDGRARKLAQRKFRYWWDRLILRAESEHPPRAAC